jgi:hypothetical protein
MLWFFTFVANTVNQQQLLISATADMLWLKRGGVLANDGRHNVSRVLSSRQGRVVWLSSVMAALQIVIPL